MGDILYGILFGAIIGIIAGLIAFFQSRPLWKKQGFAIGKNPEERELVYKYWAGQKFRNYWTVTLVPIIVLILTWMFTLLTVRDIELALIFSCFSFIIFMLLSLFLFALLADGKIRKNKLR